MLAADRPPDTERLGKTTSRRTETTRPAKERELGRAQAEVARHQAGHDDDGQRRPRRRSGHSHVRSGQGNRPSAETQLPRRKNKQGVEHDVQNAHQDAQHARNPHVAAATEHAARKKIELKERQGQRIDQKIAGRIGHDRGVSSEPAGQRAAHRAADPRQQQAEKRNGDERLTQDGPRSFHVIGADPVRRLNGKGCGRRRAHPVEKPSGRRYETDGRRGFGTETAHHRGIDVQHDDRRELSQHRRNAQPHDQLEPLPPGHRLPGTDRLQQYVLFSSLPGGHSHSTCRIILYLPSTFLSRSNPSSSSDLGHAMLSRMKSSPPGP